MLLWAAVLLAVVFVAFVVLAYRGDWAWTGFTQSRESGKTLWDWMELLVVPVGIAIIAFALNASQSSRDRTREDRQALRDEGIAADRARAEVLRTYIEQMSDLMLERHLASAPPNSAPAKVATTLTLTVLPQLDGERRGAVLQFLSNAALSTPPNPKVDLFGADLREVNAAHTVLPAIDVGGADLRDADFRDAALGEPTRTLHGSTRPPQQARAKADFTISKLKGADFRGALIDQVDFSQSDLRRANFRRARLTYAWFQGACVSNSTFARTTLVGVGFGGAEGVEVDYSRATLRDVSFVATSQFDRLLFPGPTRMTALDFTKARRVDGTRLPDTWQDDGLPMTAAERKRVCRETLRGVFALRGR